MDLFPDVSGAMCGRWAVGSLAFVYGEYWNVLARVKRITAQRLSVTFFLATIWNELGRYQAETNEKSSVQKNTGEPTVLVNFSHQTTHDKALR